MTSKQQADSPLWAKILATLIIISGLVAIIWGIARVALFFRGIVSSVESYEPDTWAMLGEIMRNTGGWVALLAALGTMSIMVATNRSRAKEAASADFRQHIQWAVEKVSSDNQFEVSFAQSVILHFAQNKPKHLSKQEHQLVLEVQSTLEKLQVLETTISNQDTTQSAENLPSDG